MTTPLNLTFAPFGRDCMLTVGFSVFLAAGCCPKTISVAVKNRARPHTKVNGRSLLISLTFIFYSPPPLQQGLQRIITESLFTSSSLGRQGEGSKIVIKIGTEINEDCVRANATLPSPL